MFTLCDIEICRIQLSEIKYFSDEICELVNAIFLHLVHSFVDLSFLCMSVKLYPKIDRAETLIEK